MKRTTRSKSKCGFSGGPLGARGPLREYTAKALERRKTLVTGQCDDLKIRTSKTRVWLSRCGVEDGEPFDNKVTIEKLAGGRWVTVEEYPG